MAWTYPFGDAGSSPIVVRGVIYGRGRNGSLVALDAATGRERWVRENMTGMTSRGMNYWESADGRDQRLIFAMNSLLQEVDAKTGKSIMSFGTNGVVDLRVGLDGRDPESIGNIQSSIPGEVFENLVIVGSATGEGYMSPPGDIRAYDVVTGKLAWTFHTVPRPGEFGYDTWPKDAWKYIGGVNNWGEMTIDTRRGIVYVPLGSPTYDFYGVDRIGSNLFGTSIVALDARTGKRLWHFQFVHHDLWDLDPSAAPQLTTIRHNGRNRDVVVVGAKTHVAVRVRSRDRRADLADRRTAGAEVGHARRAELADAAVPDQSAAACAPVVRRRRHQSVSLRRRKPRGSERDCWPRRTSACSRRSTTPTRCTSRRATAECCSAGWRPSPRPVRSTSSATTTPASCACCGQARPSVAAGRRSRRGKPCISRTARAATVPIASAPTACRRSSTRRRTRRTTSRAGAPRFDAAAIRTVVAAGKGRMPSFPHLTPADVDALVALLTTAPGGRGLAAGGRGRAWPDRDRVRRRN